MKKRNKAIIILFLLVIAGIINEYGYLRVNIHEIHSVEKYRNGIEYNIYMYEAVYYFINSIFMLMWPLTIFYLLMLFKNNWLAAKIVSLIPIFWLTIEVIQNYYFLVGINNDVLKTISDGAIWQIFITLSLTAVASYGLIKYKL